MTEHVVVTGAGGFVGGFLAKHLAAHGFKVTATTRKLLHSPQEKRPDVTWIEADLTQSISLPRQFDVLIHCAALLPSSCSDPSRLYVENATMASNSFNLAKNAKAKSIIFLSSMSVYGSIHVTEVNEDTGFDNPDAYGKAKYDAECELEKTISEMLWSGLSIRLPGTVGRGSHHNFISDTLRCICENKKIEIRNPDSYFNNIVFIQDLSNFILRWLQTSTKGYAMTNLASCEPMRIRDVVSLLYKKANKTELVIYKNTLPRPFLISLNKAIKLGFVPRTVHESISDFAYAELMQ